MERMLKIDPHYDFRRWNRWIKAVIIDNYKYIWSSDGRDELYDLSRDPDEQKNLIEDKRNTARTMRDALSHILDTLDYRDLGDLIQGSEDNIRIIEKLGYIRGGATVKGPIMRGLTP